MLLVLNPFIVWDLLLKNCYPYKQKDIQFMLILEDSLDVYKKCNRYVYIAFRENWHVSTEAQLILNKFQVYKILHIPIAVIEKRK